jgi:guanylate kinase
MNSTLVVLIGPSGVGKTTLEKAAVEKGVATYRVRSVTDRSPGKGETEADYLFVNKGEFDPGACIEHIEYAGNNYGILKEELGTALATDRPILCADIHGARQLKRYTKGEGVVLLVFVDASDEQLRARLEARGRGSVEERMARVSVDREAIPECNVCITNNDGNINESLESLRKVYEMGEALCRLKRT